MVDLHSPLEAARLIERPAEYAVLLQRPRFVELLDKRQHKLRRVLSDYSFPGLVRCGLTSCRTEHRNGFLVETEDGLETNVGHVCGRRAFGTTFDIARNEYRKLRDLQELRDRLVFLGEQLPSVRKGVAELYEARLGIKWVERTRAALAQILGPDLFDSLCVAQRRGDFDVFEYRQRTKIEIDRIVEQTRQKREQLRVERRLIGRLEPMPWIAFNFKERLQTNLISELESLSLFDAARADLISLRRRAKRLDGWESALPEAHDVVTSVARFFTAENVRLLSVWVPENQGRRRQAVLEWIGSDGFKRLSEGHY